MVIDALPRVSGLCRPSDNPAHNNGLVAEFITCICVCFEQGGCIPRQLC